MPYARPGARHPEPAAILPGTGDARSGCSGYEESPRRRTVRDGAGRLPEPVRSRVFVAGAFAAAAFGVGVSGIGVSGIGVSDTEAFAVGVSSPTGE
ncbi:hypothetical protein ACIRPQ_19570 [Streptomyces sp. NPDC101213]|uniref:hypothetical protein n=1 Tax=Streptomyces sp. NPDC101213 TaxID=3366130 RepID=UPI00380EB5B9